MFLLYYESLWPGIGYRGGFIRLIFFSFIFGHPSCAIVNIRALCDVMEVICVICATLYGWRFCYVIDAFRYFLAQMRSPYSAQT